MAVRSLSALAQAYRSDDLDDIEMLVVGKHLPDEAYPLSHEWDVVLNLGRYEGASVYFYRPQGWHYYNNGNGDSGYVLSFYEEETVDGALVDFELMIPETSIDRVIFINPGTDDISTIPEHAELFQNGDFKIASQTREISA